MKSFEKDNFTDVSLIKLTCEVVASYVSNNVLSGEDLPEFIRSVYMSLSDIQSDTVVYGFGEKAMSIRDSITDEYLICLEDGKRFKSLKRHLRAKYNMSPEEYREKWRLPSDYPMVSPAYARERSKLARKMGLGQAKE